LGSTFDQITKIIGYPIEVQKAESKSGKTFSSYNYRVKEHGYKFKRFIKPDSGELNFWSDSEYFLQFNFENNILKSISRRDINSLPSDYKYYEEKSLSEIKLGKVVTMDNKPLWIDINDLFNVNVGMNEDTVNKILGLPSQLISWKQDGKKEIKSVFYRSREVYDSSVPSPLNPKNRFQMGWKNVEKNIEKENYIVLKKGSEKLNFMPGSLKLSGSKVYFSSLNDQRIEHLESAVKSIMYNGTLFKKFSKLKKLITNVKEPETEKKKLTAGIWSPTSISIEFYYEDGKLTHYRRTL
jgi:hypothetical protein